jgi:hypothetical protein
MGFLKMTEELVQNILQNRGTWVRRMAIANIAIGLMFCTGAYRTGKIPARLLWRGEKTTGKVVDFELANFGSSPLFGTSPIRNKWMPIVEFNVNGESYRFRDRIAAPEYVSAQASTKPAVNYIVHVLYDPSNPNIAMIENPLATKMPIHWIPWFPLLAFGIVLLLVGFKNLMLTSKIKDLPKI